MSGLGGFAVGFFCGIVVSFGGLFALFSYITSKPSDFDYKDDDDEEDPETVDG